ncbi:hypothetical protein JI721_09245 [Alicyclobacillus cycloheptanicus]|uniref:Uncharacterized protein n=1 Tax=Alicyclobacillus cycloheptanicus TaxID=1457 RepID=A0ABT9XH96_9BACL|nr:hypothetical protein [Alicyclobacillus cycloheptanicus]MDQ0189658.1 hypothetical protein [Alicyclobacillus cycloheptanicus]WDL99958.1 hypothetical protein JI721_09245 [Alicyclobacillus cycloheptanicus]
MVNVQLGAIQSGGWSDNVGIFTGQNIQNSWDSHSTGVNAANGQFGDWNRSFILAAYNATKGMYGQPIFDRDLKGNQSHLHIGW